MKKTRDVNNRKQGFTYTLKDVFCEKPNIEIVDNTLATLEGSKGVLEYSETVIKINLGSFIVAFCGRNLNLKCISPSALVIEGFFQNIEFSV